MADWNQFKEITEALWKNYSPCEKGVSGFQIQTGTKWNNGLSIEKIKNLEVLFDIALPIEYKKMLIVINGFDRENVDFYEEEKQYFRSCYKYPDDWEVVQKFIAELYDHMETIKIVLKESKLAEKEIKGFIPLYSHRALVVFENLELTPVISAIGDDIIIYGHSLIEYWIHEFKLEASVGCAKPGQPLHT
jgi:hypothetical protein